MKQWVGLMATAAALAGAAGAAAQPARPDSPAAAAAAPARAPADAKAVVAEIRRLLAENYVLPEMRPKLDAALAKSLAQGRYDTADPAVLAERINADLAATGRDKHLNFRYAPEQAARTAAPGSPQDGPSEAEALRRAQMQNHGLVEMKVLPGNVRYLDVAGFVWAGPRTAEAYDNAMRFLQGGDAAIIDLRRNGGGSPAAVQYLISHFVAPQTPLITFHMGPTKVDKVASLPELPAGRMVGKPLYVLTSGRTMSAAEEFAGHVGGYKLGELIGETTAGGGFRNDFFPIAGGFVLSISVGRAVLASTGKDWEGVGIVPTTAVEQSKALDVAQLHAVRRLAAAAPPREKAQLDALANVLSAKVDPVATALPLSAYAGKFGERAIRLEGGQLTYQRGGGAKLTMIPVGPNSFGFYEDAGRIEYALAGGAPASFDLIRPDGTRQTIVRTP